MKKLLRPLFILLLLALGFLYVVKNPDLPISQNILTTLGIDMSMNEGTGVDLTNCLSYFDGCNTCMVSGGVIGGCTKMFCQTPAEPQCLEYEWTGMDLSGCISYFDGCNNCIVENGRPSACTLMYCETPSEPKCNQYASGSEMTGSETTVQTTDTYIIKTEKGSAIPGEHIYVYNLNGTKIFSLIANNDPSLQRFYNVVGDNLIVDYGTSASQRTFIIYDIPTQKNIFQSDYYPSENNSLSIKNNTIQFYFVVRNEYQQTTKPADAPTCTDMQNAYAETRIFNLSTKQLEKTGILTCTYTE